MMEQLEDIGYTAFDGTDEPDLCIINTCTVTKKSDRKSRRAIRKIIRDHPEAKIIVTGCGVENPHSKLKDIMEVDAFVGNEGKNNIISYLDNKTEKQKIRSSEISRFFDKDRAFVKVQDGCDNYCSYCIVPYVRGRSKSRSIESIEKEVKNLVEQGYKEIVLTAINLGAYGKDLGTNLVELINRLTSIKQLGRLRLSSIIPTHIDEDLLKIMKMNEKICPHLHLAVQSGDNRILKKMNRNYKIQNVRSILNQAYRQIPNIGVSIDLIVGFPSETDINFKNTLKLVKEYNFVKTHIFTYSDRELTVAHNFDGKIDSKIKQQRYSKLKKEAFNSAQRFKKRFLNKKLNILVENSPDKETNLLCGYTENYIKTYLADGKTRQIKGKIVPAELTRLENNRVYSEAI
jgi:threonylcarbamoyladenosine tRNA methylthiotransferase MtaB